MRIESVVIGALELWIGINKTYIWMTVLSRGMGKLLNLYEF